MEKNKYKGILFILMAAFFFALMNLFVRLSGDIPSIQKSFFRNLVALIFAYLILKKNKIAFSGKKENLKHLIWRSIFGTLGILCNFYAVDHLVLADASMLNKLSPFFAILFSFFLLKEKISPVQLICVVVAFIGALFIIKPTVVGMDMIPSIIGLLGGLSAGFAYTMVRILGQKGEKGPFIVFFFSTFSCVITLPYLIFNYHPMSLKQLFILLLAGLAAAGGQFSITSAYCYAPAKELSVYDYSQVVFSAFFGWIVFGQIPDRYSWLGYVVICGTAIFMYLYLRRKDKEK